MRKLLTFLERLWRPYTVELLIFGCAVLVAVLGFTLGYSMGQRLDNTPIVITKCGETGAVTTN